MIKEQKDKVAQRMKAVNVTLKTIIPALKSNIEFFKFLEELALIKYQGASFFYKPILYFFDLIPSRKMVKNAQNQLEQVIISRMSFRYTIKKFKML